MGFNRSAWPGGAGFIKTPAPAARPFQPSAMKLPDCNIEGSESKGFGLAGVTRRNSNSAIDWSLESGDSDAQSDWYRR